MKENKNNSKNAELIKLRKENKRFKKELFLIKRIILSKYNKGKRSKMFDLN